MTSYNTWSREWFNRPGNELDARRQDRLRCVEVAKSIVLASTASMTSSGALLHQVLSTAEQIEEWVNRV